jgi:G:T/U-mismatch repair DNA glycosylase
MRRPVSLSSVSFPSPASLAAGQYYAHKQNQFWCILAALLEQSLVEMDYVAKQASVKVAGIVIWDNLAAIFGAVRDWLKVRFDVRVVGV